LDGISDMEEIKLRDVVPYPAKEIKPLIDFLIPLRPLFELNLAMSQLAYRLVDIILRTDEILRK